jgi:hypothetical protein
MEVAARLRYIPFVRRRRKLGGIDSLERRAASARLSIEVEHVLDVVHSDEPDAATRLRSLSYAHAWSGLEGKAQKLVPLAAWADLVARLLEHGPEALVELALLRDNPEAQRSMALTILESAADRGGRGALLRVATVLASRLPDDIVLAAECASRLNEAFFGLPVAEPDAAPIRAFLHDLLGQELIAAQRATAACALRWFGDQESIRIIKALPPLPSPWADAPSTCIRRVQARLRSLANARPPAT